MAKNSVKTLFFDDRFSAILWPQTYEAVELEQMLTHQSGLSKHITILIFFLEALTPLV